MAESTAKDREGLPVRTWEHIHDCCKPSGTFCTHSLEEPLIVCGHARPLKPVDHLSPAFLEDFETGLRSRPNDVW